MILRNKIILFSILLLLPVPSDVFATSFQDTVTVGTFPRDMVLDANSGNLYVPNYESGTISVIDAHNMIIKDTVFLGKQSHPSQIVVDSNRELVFASDKISGTLTIIDGKNNKVIESIDIGDALWDLDINQNNGKLYVADLLQNKIFVIDVNSLDVIKSIPVTPNPWAVEVNQNNNLVFVASGTSETIHVIDGDTDDIIYEFNPGKKPWNMSINEQNNLLYVTSWDSDKISVIELDNYQTVSEIPITSGVWQITTNQNNGVTIASNEHTNELYFIDENSIHFKTIEVPSSPQALSINPTHNTVYMTNPISNSVSSITYDYQKTQNSEINNVSEKKTKEELVSDTLTGIYEIPQRNDVDYDLVSNLLQNLGITGEFNGNEIASILLEDYNEKKDLQPKTVVVPKWATELAVMFVEDADHDMPEKINCNDDYFSSIDDFEKANPYEIWVNILPICALS